MPTTTVALADLPVGASARVTSVQANPGDSYAERLTSLGLVPGTLLTVQRKAPFGDPVEVRVRGFSLALRPSEAACLVLETGDLPSPANTRKATAADTAPLGAETSAP